MALPNKGDRAFVIKHCCSKMLYGGVVEVGGTVKFDEEHALACEKSCKGLTIVEIFSDEHKFKGLPRPMCYPREWLVRIDPLKENIDEEERKEITA